MVLFIDIEHSSALDDPVYRAERSKTMRRRKELFAELANEPCVVRHYSEFAASELDDPTVSALVTSGNRSLWETYNIPDDFRALKDAVKNTQKPVLGICGGHQLLGLLFGGEARPMRSLNPNEIDSHPQYQPGWLKEWGYYSIEYDTSDPLFEGCSNPLVVEEMHFWELNQLPEGFQTIASNANCAIQAMRHKANPTYGVQFHPEFHDSEHTDGRRLLQNFFSLTKS